MLLARQLLTTTFHSLIIDGIYIYSRDRLDLEALLIVILTLVVVLLILELIDTTAGFLPIFSQLLIIVLILLWYFD
jgi:hypothetical protein